ncbi:hypothetical protein EYF80_006039 [Liparis tanakae]|uniref:Uncharacterized protein n=1 Tax=Liparis tanakae TaxID=230148 RepID=A0A4Z2J0P5_9TELE|nr:hypothetical protein EYF80_006039 [Liparis tanakae]
MDVPSRLDAPLEAEPVPFDFQTILGCGSPEAWHTKEATPPWTAIWSSGVRVNLGGADCDLNILESGSNATRWKRGLSSPPIGLTHGLAFTDYKDVRRRATGKVTANETRARGKTDMQNAKPFSTLPKSGGFITAAAGFEAAFVNRTNWHRSNAWLSTGPGCECLALEETDTGGRMRREREEKTEEGEDQRGTEKNESSISIQNK